MNQNLKILIVVREPVARTVSDHTQVRSYIILRTSVFTLQIFTVPETLKYIGFRGTPREHEIIFKILWKYAAVFEADLRFFRSWFKIYPL